MFTCTRKTFFVYCVFRMVCSFEKKLKLVVTYLQNIHYFDVYILFLKHFIIKPTRFLIVFSFCFAFIAKTIFFLLQTFITLQYEIFLWVFTRLFLFFQQSQLEQYGVSCAAPAGRNVNPHAAPGTTELVASIISRRGASPRVLQLPRRHTTPSPIQNGG